MLDQDSSNKKAFQTLIELTYVQLLLLNRRRVGELQRLTVETYTSNINNKSSGEFNTCISESEKVLMRLFKRVVIRGKRGRGVPVLFTDEMAGNADLIVKLREQFVSSSNMYLFANINSSTESISGAKAVYKHVRLAGVKDAAALTSTKLRKHLATMSQVINLSQQDLEQLANFMGHTTDIHKTYYRLPNDIYQMAKVSKLLLLNEKGQAAKYKGKTLDEINVSLDIEENDNSDDDVMEAENIETEVDKPTSNTTNDKPKNVSVTYILYFIMLIACVLQQEISANIKRVLEPWTEDQKKVTISFFKKLIKEKIPPKKKECLQLQEENPGLFGNKTWPKIKIFVVNSYNKIK